MASSTWNSLFSIFKQNYLYQMPVIGWVLRMFDAGKTLFNKDSSGSSIIDKIGSGVGDFVESGKTGNNLVDSYLANEFQSDVTGRDIALNNLNLQNVHDSWQANVSGMMDAGLNPAMVYGRGSASTNAPSLSNSGSVGGLGDLLALATLPAQLKLMKAQAAKTESEAGLIYQKTLTEQEITRIQKIAADYGIDMKEAEIQNLWSRTFNLTRDSNLKMANENYVNSQRQAQDIINANLNEKLKSEINSNNASAASAAASAAFTTIQANYAKEHKCLMSSSDLVVIATYLGNLFHTSPEQIVDKFLDYVKSDEFKKDMNPWSKVSSEDAMSWYLSHDSRATKD